MKVSLSRIDLVSVIGKLQNIVPIKAQLPILSNILIECLENELVITASDLSISMRACLKAEILEKGSITLPARRFFQLIRELTSPEITLETKAETVQIRSGTSIFKMGGMDGSSFPNFPDTSSSRALIVDGIELKEVIASTSFATSKDETRPNLSGLHLTVDKELATFTATDGKRLSRNRLQVKNPSNLNESYLIPIKAVEEICSLTEGSEVTLLLANERIAIDTGSFCLVAKLLSENFPDVLDIIPKPLENPLILHKEELSTLLKQLSLFCSAKQQVVSFAFGNGALEISVANSEMGEGKVSMPVNYQGENLTIGFNPFFFLEALRYSKGETIRFSITSPFEPTLIQDDSAALFVIMPVRILEEMHV